MRELEGRRNGCEMGTEEGYEPEETRTRSSHGVKKLGRELIWRRRGSVRLQAISKQNVSDTLPH